MKVVETISELRAWRRAQSSSVGFVPTMGALHQGHLSLVQLSRSRADKTVVSIFVNPLQFGPKEDFSRYPRPLELDRALLEEAGVDVLFVPGVEEMYPQGPGSTFVVEEKTSLPLCGEFRPGHFRGVATVVLKLFNLVQPDLAFFGQKDAQQCIVLETMVRELNVPVTLVRGPTLREPDGLALSSRNIYLSPEERKEAPRIYRSLERVAEAWRAGERDPEALERHGRSVLEPGFQVQYFEVRDATTLERPRSLGNRRALVAVAAYLGSTRLIDNLELTPSG